MRTEYINVFSSSDIENAYKNNEIKEPTDIYDVYGDLSFEITPNIPGPTFNPGPGGGSIFYH